MRFYGLAQTGDKALRRAVGSVRSHSQRGIAQPQESRLCNSQLARGAARFALAQSGQRIACLKLAHTSSLVATGGIDHADACSLARHAGEQRHDDDLIIWIDRKSTRLTSSH